MKTLIILLGISATASSFGTIPWLTKRQENPIFDLQLTSDDTVNRDLAHFLSETENYAVLSAKESFAVLKKKVIEDASKFANTMGKLLQYGKGVAENANNKLQEITEYTCNNTHCYLCVFDKAEQKHPVKVCFRWTILEHNSVRQYHLCVNDRCALINYFFSARDALCAIYPPAPALWACLRIKEMNLKKETFNLCFYLELNVLKWPVFTSRSYCVKLREDTSMPYIARWNEDELIKFFSFS
ncbi:uncharacterized protein LOC106666674 [Cimex lectularius]|uniref:DUF4773 domain-containing protein n=1 Tax=Cimex lectularius TaxID=79782 RepID=A0A8I6RTQ6_CIMLE|nr:uncharacterized protein LOC106666674 [Cimex lectularius]